MGRLKKKEEIRRKLLLKQGLKFCPYCKSIKELQYFFKHRRNKDGLDCYCKNCRLAIKKYSRKIKSEYLEQFKDYPDYPDCLYYINRLNINEKFKHGFNAELPYIIND